MDYSQLTKDFNQRYQNTWVWLTFPDGVCEFVRISKAFLKESGSFPLIEFYSKSLGTNVIKFTTDYKFQFKRPPVGLFQDGKYAILCARAMSQTYSKGVSPDTYHLSMPFHNYAPGVKGPYYGSGDQWSECIKKAFEPKHFTKEEAIYGLNNGKFISVALSSRLALSLSMDSNDSFDVYHFTTYLGKISKHGTPKFDTTDLGLTEI